jgi:hypothetical protein
MRIASLKYRFSSPGFELPGAVRRAQQAYDDRSAGTLEDIADRIEGNARPPGRMSGGSLEHLEQAVQECCAPYPQQMPQVPLQSFIVLMREIDGLINSLAEDIAPL